MSVSLEQVKSILLDICKVIEEQKDYLSTLDQAIGDGDHGFNMARGFEIVREKMKNVPGTDIGELLKITAMALISNVGGASGPLYGTLFLRASGSAKGLTAIDLPGFITLFRDGIKGVQERGKAEVGEKTMIDVLVPVLESLEKDSSAGLLGKEAFSNAAIVAAECAEKTKNIQASKGRASYLGERSIGHIDPGAMSSCLIIQTISKALDKQ
jgi:dihydroxyacetone kinase-like protein